MDILWWTCGGREFWTCPPGEGEGEGEVVVWNKTPIRAAAPMRVLAVPNPISLACLVLLYQLVRNLIPPYLPFAFLFHVVVIRSLLWFQSWSPVLCLCLPRSPCYRNGVQR